MKFISLKIKSEFRNLEGLRLSLSEKNDTYVLIGNNGTGKTNILEALSSVFYSLLFKETFEFSFVLLYKLDDDSYRISYDIATGQTEYKKNNMVVNESEMAYPNRVICNYSGEDTRIWENYYKKPYNTYIEGIKRNTVYDILKMVYIDRTMWRYVLLSMISARRTNIAFDDFLTNKIGIKPEDPVTIEMLIDRDRFKTWRDNQVKLLVQTVANRQEEIVSDQSTDISVFNPFDDEPRDLFHKYMGAGDLIRSLTITYNGNIEAGYLSEGEKKMMVVLFILESLSDERTLVLMDEPDSHIHISRKAELNEMFNSMNHRSNLITSHSPTLTAKFNPDCIIMLDRKSDGRVDIIDKKNVDLINRLTDGIWTAQRQNIFLASHDDVLLVEGSTDITFIKAALSHFHEQGKYTDLSFEYIPCGGASHMKDFASIFKPKEGQTVIGFLDGDRAGRESMHKIIKNPAKGATEWDLKKFGKARKCSGVWFSFYPVWKGKKNADNFNVEDYFTCTLFRKYILSFSSLDTIKNKDGLKSILEKECKKGMIKPKFYEKFNTLFNHIQSIKDAENQGLIEF